MGFQVKNHKPLVTKFGTGTTPPPLTGTPSFVGDYETGNLSQYDTTATFNYRNALGGGSDGSAPCGPPVIVTSPVVNGTYAAYHWIDGNAGTTYNGGTLGNPRCETVARDQQPYQPLEEGERWWFRGSLLLSSGFPVNANTWQIMCQWKNDSTGSPPVEFEISRNPGQFVIDGNNGAWHHDTGVLVSVGVVYEMVFDITFSVSTTTSNMNAWISTAGGAFVQVASNLKPVGNGFLYSGQSSYFKHGWYRDQAITYTGRQGVYHGGWIIGDSAANVGFAP